MSTTWLNLVDNHKGVSDEELFSRYKKNGEIPAVNSLIARYYRIGLIICNSKCVNPKIITKDDLSCAVEEALVKILNRYDLSKGSFHNFAINIIEQNVNRTIGKLNKIRHFEIDALRLDDYVNNNSEMTYHDVVPSDVIIDFGEEIDTDNYLHQLCSPSATRERAARSVYKLHTYGYSVKEIANMICLSEYSIKEIINFLENKLGKNKSKKKRK